MPLGTNRSFQPCRDFLENRIEWLGDIPTRIEGLHFTQITVIADVIANTVFV